MKRPAKPRKPTEQHTPPAPFPMMAVSNGEWCPYAPNKKQIAAARMVLEETDRNARRAGMTRRQFLCTAAGTATTFMVLNKIHGFDAWGDNAILPVRKVQCEDIAAGNEMLDHKPFVMDVQTHHLDVNHPNAEAICELLSFCETFGAIIGADCSELTCPDKLGQLSFIKELFIDSQTSMGIISGVPNGTILGPQLMSETRDLVNQLAGSERTIMQAMIDPTRALGEITSLDTFEHQVNDLGARALKCYTYNGNWRLDDETIAYPMLQEAQRLGLELINVHKGLATIFGQDPEYVRATDFPKAVRDFPDLKFCAYHAGFFFNNEHPEGLDGITEFIQVVERMDRRDRKRVYAEIGSTFAIALLLGPDQAAHLMGQLLKTFGARRILWGTDSMWWGSPQFLIDAFLNLEIPASMREQFGYPRLTMSNKRRILGLNAAKLYRVKKRQRKNLCTIPQDALAQAQEAKGGPRAERSLRSYGPRTREDYFALLRRDDAVDAIKTSV